MARPLRKPCHINFRAEQELKQMLEKAAAANGRTLSDEAAERLRESFRHDLKRERPLYVIDDGELKRVEFVPVASTD